MDKTQKIKEIVATFLKTTSERVAEDTIIDNTTIVGSIWIHRMYAVLARDLNVDIQDYQRIKTFGELVHRLNGGPEAIKQESCKEELDFSGLLSSQGSDPVNTSQPIQAGIDMEDIDHLPTVKDFRKDPFYVRNFSAKEIEYCLAQPNPLQSFAGLFAAKEAIIKADNVYKKVPFHQLEIVHDQNGKPSFADFSISISHSRHQVVALAIRLNLTI